MCERAGQVMTVHDKPTTDSRTAAVMRHPDRRATGCIWQELRGVTVPSPYLIACARDHVRAALDDSRTLPFRPALRTITQQSCFTRYRLLRSLTLSHHHTVHVAASMGSAASKPASFDAREVTEKESVQEVARTLSGLSLAGPASEDGTLSPSNISDWEEQIAETPSIELARTVLNHTDVKQALLNRKAIVTDQHIFNTELKLKTGPITNQKSSGRCWLFATTNVLRYNVMKRFNLDDFQLSQVRCASSLCITLYKQDVCSRTCSSMISSTRRTITSS